MLPIGHDRAPRDGQLTQRQADQHAVEQLEVRNPPGTHVPTLEHEARIVHEVVVVEMGEERPRHVDRTASALHQPLMGPRTMIEDQRLAADFDEVAGALTLE